MKIKLNIGTFRQSKAHLCGPASLKIILDNFGDYFSEEQIAKETNITERYGIFPPTFVNFLTLRHRISSRLRRLFVLFFKIFMIHLS